MLKCEKVLEIKAFQTSDHLHGIAFTIKAGKKDNHRIEGYFDYVGPPLEGFWWQDGIAGIDYAHRDRPWHQAKNT